MGEYVGYKVSAKNLKVRRGDIFFADLNMGGKPIGSEQCGKRPVLIIQNDKGNMFSRTTIVAMLTTKIKKNMPTHVVVENEKVLPEKSVVCAEQIRTIDKIRLRNYCGNVGGEIMDKVDEALKSSMDIKQLEDTRDMNKAIDDNIIEISSDEVVLDISFEDLEHDWLKMVEKQLVFFTHIRQHISNLEREKERLEQEIEEILDFIENTSFNAPQGYKVYKMLRCRREKRKEHLREISNLKALLEEFDCQAMVLKYQRGLNKMKEQDQKLREGRVFNELLELSA